MNNVVAIAYIKDRKVLVVKSVRSAKQNLYTLVGGLVENETLLEACVRESKEEINQELEVYTNSFEELFSYEEGAASDPSMLVNIHVYLSKKDLDIELNPDLEILEYKFIDSQESREHLSTSIQRFLDYVKDKDMID